MGGKLESIILGNLSQKLGRSCTQFRLQIWGDRSHCPKVPYCRCCLSYFCFLAIRMAAYNVSTVSTCLLVTTVACLDFMAAICWGCLLGPAGLLQHYCGQGQPGLAPVVSPALFHPTGLKGNALRHLFTAHLLLLLQIKFTSLAVLRGGHFLQWWVKHFSCNIKFAINTFIVHVYVPVAELLAYFVWTECRALVYIFATGLTVIRSVPDCCFFPAGVVPQLLPLWPLLPHCLYDLAADLWIFLQLRGPCFSLGLSAVWSGVHFCCKTVVNAAHSQREFCSFSPLGVLPHTFYVFMAMVILKLCQHFCCLLSRVVNIAVLVLLPILSAILLEYWHDYRRYFSSVVSKWVSAILFSYFLPILDINTFVSKQRRCGCCTTTTEAHYRGYLPARTQLL